MESIRYDAVPLRATMTPEGYLRDSPVIGRSGVQEYKRADGTIRREYRPPDVVFSAEALAGLHGIPIIDQHVGLMTAANVRQHSIGTVLSAGRQDGQTLVADIVIHDPTPVTKFGRKELSLAYAVRTDETPGETPEGEAYDARIEAITRYDHLAIVAKGRAGVARLRMDSDDAESTDLPALADIPADKDKPIMANEAPPANAPKLVVVRVDGIEYSAVPEVERALNRLNADLAAAKLRADAAEAARDTLQGTIDKHAAEIEQVRSDAAGTVRARLELEGVAKTHSVEVRMDDSDRVIREKVIRKLQSDDNLKFDGKSDDYVGFAFDAAVEQAAKASKTKQENRAAVNGAGQVPAVRADAAGKPVINSAAAARQVMERRRLAI